MNVRIHRTDGRIIEDVRKIVDVGHGNIALKRKEMG